MRFLALQSGVHTIDGLTLTDLETGDTISLRYAIISPFLTSLRHVTLRVIVDPLWTLRFFRVIFILTLAVDLLLFLLKPEHFQFSSKLWHFSVYYGYTLD